MFDQTEENLTFEEKQEQNMTELIQSTSIFAGLDSKTIVNLIIEQLKQNDDAKAELYKTIKVEMGFDAEPFFENYLGKRKNKKTHIKDLEQPYREVVEEVLSLYDEGYHVEQIAEMKNWTRTAVNKAISQRERYEKEIEEQDRRIRMRELAEEKAEREAILALLPWWKRTIVRILGMKVK